MITVPEDVLERLVAIVEAHPATPEGIELYAREVRELPDAGPLEDAAHETIIPRGRVGVVETPVGPKNLLVGWSEATRTLVFWMTDLREGLDLDTMVHSPEILSMEEEE